MNVMSVNSRVSLTPGLNLKSYFPFKIYDFSVNLVIDVPVLSLLSVSWQLIWIDTRFI